ncbi:hypothetical protein HHK36_033276 [Tetracentron sinense]|uniref:ABC transporter domain-containing protein n=1 Tax=Tetracentron sinense TaxID=13715 RepID=A0A834Y5F1_TETSI|nr:hypothetical protein HHK36_033276 [Tetracentron sinense]
MPRVGADLPVLHRQHSMELDDHDRSANFNASLTLGELLKYDGESRKDATGDQTPPHQVLELSGMGLEPRSLPFVLSFSNLTYSVKIPRKFTVPTFSRGKNRLSSADDLVGNERNFLNTKTLLNDISGEAREGELLAVLGGSGSGKSTLIDALANRIAKGSLKGSITLNGEALESRLLKVISAYVMQDDLLFPMLTVEETLMFSAEFRLPRSLSKSKKKARVQALIDQLGLRNAAKTVIGDEGHRGVSGGERRRVSIGIDIIHEPIILFLDEPTSGLDSTSAFMVVKVLQRIAQTGSIVIMSVHQPSYRIFSLFDRLIFLSRGQTVYSGSQANIPHFFAEVGHPIPETENRIEFALDWIRELEGSPGGIKDLVEFHKTWQNMNNCTGNCDSDPQGLSLKDTISASISRGKLVSGATNDSGPTSSVPTFANPLLIEMAVLSKRSIMNSRRMPELFGMRLGTVMVTDALPVFLQKRYIFMRETAYNAYRRSSYVLSHALVALPSLIFLSAAFAAISFCSVGLAGGISGFVFFFFIIFASFWAGSSFVTFLSGVVPHVMLGYTVGVAILAYFLLFSGFFITRNRIPPYWIWFHYISLVKYPYEAVLQNEFNDPTKCFGRGAHIFDNTPLGAFDDSMKIKLLQSLSGTLGMNITSSTCVTTGPDILRQQGITDLSKWNCLWITVAWGFFFRFLFYFSLLLGSKNKRR